LYAQEQAAPAPQSGSGRRGASLDRKRIPRSARAVRQLVEVVTIETACHGLDRSDPDVPPGELPVRFFFHMRKL
jgi:hypothetical protein